MIHLADGSKSGHLYVVLTTPNLNGEVAVVNFTEQTANSDQTVTFSNRDSILFIKPTVVSYPDANLIDASVLVKLARGDEEECEPDILNEIIEGAFRSSGTPNRVIQELRRDYPDIYGKFNHQDWID